MTWIDKTKHSSTFINKNRDFAGLYGIARYGISTYGTATTGDGFFIDQTKHSSTFITQSKH